MNPPEFSVIVPVYNTGVLLQETIDSVLNQTVQDFELILVDDGSTDEETVKLLASQKDPRIRVIRQNNSGVASARNTGVASARGKYIAFLDHDDLFLPDKLKLSVEMFHEYEDTVLVFSEIIPMGDFYGRVLKLKTFSGNVWDKLFVQNFIYSMSCVVVERDFLTQHHIQFHDDCVPCDDWDFHLQCARYGSIRCTLFPLVKYRFHDENQSVDFAKMHNSGIRVIQKYAKILPEIAQQTGIPISVLKKSKKRVCFLFYLTFAFQCFQKKEYRAGVEYTITAWKNKPFLCTKRICVFILKKTAQRICGQ